MDTSEPKPTSPSELNELREQCASLRQLLGSLLILVLVISGTLNIYLWRQFRLTSLELKVLRPQVGQLVADYQRVTEPAIKEFLKKLNDYERTHPDFTPIMLKYNLKAAATNIAVASPAVSGALPASKK
jgi:hypothetical protein